MFKHRSYTKELLDSEVANDDLILNLKELHSINRLLGGYKVSINAFKQLDLKNKTIVDIGSGGGDMLNQIYKYASIKGISCNFFGVDLKPECTEYAKSHLPKELTFITDDYRNVSNHINKIDFLHACLFTHHLDDNQIVELIKFALNHNTTLVINDLHRNPIAYYSIKWLTRLFSKSHLVRNDAPLSVLRGFKRTEWSSFLKSAGATNYNLKWKWAFRHQVIVHG